MKKPTKKQLWATYVSLMFAARAAALALADAFERYLLVQHRDYMGRVLHDTTIAEYAWKLARDAAEPYHFAPLKSFCGYAVNASPDEILAAVRELRGSEVPHVVERKDGEGKLVSYRYENDGIAGYFVGEVRSMAKFNAPRRLPDELVATRIPLSEDTIGAPYERCCFCYRESPTWTKVPRRAPGEQVACCRSCARWHRPSDVPSKAAWEKSVEERLPYLLEVA